MGSSEEATGPSLAFALQRAIGALGGLVLGGRGCLLTFHRAAPRREWAALPDRNFYLDLEFLDRLLAYLSTTGWDVVTMEDVTVRAARNASGDRYVNFSVDDCYRDTIEHVVPLFRRHNVPVTIFVTTGIPDDTLLLWRSGLELILAERDVVQLSGQAVDVSTTDRKREAYGRITTAWDGTGAQAAYLAFCDANGFDTDAIHRRYAVNWDMLDGICRDACVEIGAHTVTHPRMASLSPEEVLREMTESRARLMERLGLPVRHFAFPYGRAGDCGKRDFDLARRAGYSSASTAVKGLVRGGSDPFSLPRNTLNGAHRHIALAEAHLTGLTGLAARAFGRV